MASQSEDRVSGSAEETILRYLREQFGDPEIDSSLDIFTLGYVNSLFALELVTFVERVFGIAVDSEDLCLDNFRSVDAMARLVRRKHPGTGSPR